MPARYYRELLKFCLRLTKDRDLAIDAIQEGYARTLSSATQPVKHPRAFLKQVVLNVLRDHWREERLRTSLFVDAPQVFSIQGGDSQEDGAITEPMAPSSWQPERRVEARQRLALLQKAIDSLPERQREAFLLYRFENVSQEEIAKRMGISVRMVEKHIQLAMLHCKRQMKDTSPTSPRV